MRTSRGMAGWVGVVVVVGWAGGVSGQRLTPGVDAMGESGQFELARTEAEAGRFAEAYSRLSGLVERDPAGMVKVGGGVESVSEAIAGLSGEVRAGLARAADGAGGEDRGQRDLAVLAARGDADPVEFVRLARRYPMSGAVGAMWAEAAGRSAVRGDAVSARQMYDRAEAAGWRGAHLGATADGMTGGGTAVVAAYPWFGKMPDRLGGIRLFPVATGGVGGAVVFAASASHVVALRESGGVPRVEWAFPEAGAVRTVEPWTPGRLEFPVFQPAVLCDSGGTARVVVARHMGERMPGEWTGYLRALRASDGRPIWSTLDGTEGLVSGRGLSFCSAPAIAGRYVYGLATESGGREGGAKEGGAGLSLVGLDVMTGRVLFVSRVGALSEAPVVGRGVGGKRDVFAKGPGLWDESTPVAVWGDRVYVAAGGAVMAFDRFDGQMARAVTYTAVAGEAREGNAPGEQPMSRWNSTPVVTDALVVVTPRDSESVLAYDRRTMKAAWEAPRLGGFTAVGLVGGGHLLLQSRDELMSVELKSGEPAWRVGARGGAKFAGPAVVQSSGGGGGDVVVVPTDRGLAAAGGRSGEWMSEAGVTVARMWTWLSGESVGVLKSADVLAAFFQAGEEKEGGPGGKVIPLKPPPQPPKPPTPNPRLPDPRVPNKPVR